MGLACREGQARRDSKLDNVWQAQTRSQEARGGSRPGERRECGQGGAAGPGTARSDERAPGGLRREAAGPRGEELVPEMDTQVQLAVGTQATAAVGSWEE